MMDYYSYNVACLITSMLMLIILSFKFKEIDLCLILLLAAIFSIIWRSMKIIKGKEEIEKDNNHISNTNNDIRTYPQCEYLFINSYNK